MPSPSSSLSKKLRIPSPSVSVIPPSVASRIPSPSLSKSRLFFIPSPSVSRAQAFDGRSKETASIKFPEEPASGVLKKKVVEV